MREPVILTSLSTTGIRGSTPCWTGSEPRLLTPAAPHLQLHLTPQMETHHLPQKVSPPTRWSSILGACHVTHLHNLININIFCFIKKINLCLVFKCCFVQEWYVALVKSQCSLLGDVSLSETTELLTKLPPDELFSVMRCKVTRARKPPLEYLYNVAGG